MNSNELKQRTECGDCSMCCKLLKIEPEPEPDLVPPYPGKEWNTWCPDCQPGRREGGCMRYHNRPQACKTFQCIWLQSHQRTDVSSLHYDLKPNRSHVVLAPSFDDYMVMFAYVDPSHPNAWKTGMMKQHLTNVARLGVTVVVVSKDRRFIVTKNNPTIELTEDQVQELADGTFIRRDPETGKIQRGVRTH